MTISKMLLVVLPSVIILTVVMLGVAIFYAVIMQNVVRLSVFMLSFLTIQKNNFVYLFNAALYNL
jgi:hypothetical protein